MRVRKNSDANSQFSNPIDSHTTLVFVPRLTDFLFFLYLESHQVQNWALRQNLEKSKRYDGVYR